MSYDGNISELSLSDQYLHQMGSIPRLSERMSCMLYRRQLNMAQEELKPDLTMLRSAADELKKSTRFKIVLATVLQLGNQLNGGTFRGDADGFQLGDLLKVRLRLGTPAVRYGTYSRLLLPLQLKDTRASNASGATPTLLHFLARVFLNRDPLLLQYLDEMPHLEAASRSKPLSIRSAL